MGVWADPIWTTHDEIIARIQNAFSRISKEAVANAFIAGLGQRRADLRTYIAGWAMAKHLPTHKAAYLSEDLPCSVCCLERGRDGSETVELDFTHYRLNRCDYGALGLFESVMVNLEDFPGDIEPTDQDRAALASLLDFLRLLPPDSTPSKLAKSIGPIAGKAGLQRTSTIEILGVIGILEPKNHPSYWRAWTDFVDRAEPGGRNDWAYPVVMWKGTDGVNEEAVQDWFGRDFAGV